MHYLVDGYNLFFRLPLEKRSLEAGRDEIIACLMGHELSLTIVFDGGGDDVPHRTHKGPIEIVYTSKGQTADSYILDEVSWVKKPKEYTVVTSDKKLAAHCKAAGAGAQTIASFLAALRKKKRIKVEEKPFKETERELQRLLKIFSR